MYIDLDVTRVSKAEAIDYVRKFSQSTVQIAEHSTGPTVIIELYGNELKYLFKVLQVGIGELSK